MGHQYLIEETILVNRSFMKVLAIDTTTFLGSIAIVDNDRLIASVQQGTEVTYSERLIAGINHVIDGAGWKVQDVDLIAVACGPGSFTGLRIGMGTAKGLAMAIQKPMVGVSSLEVLALGVSLYPGIVIPVIDARRDEVYSSAYRFVDGEMREVLLSEHVSPPAVLCERIKALNENIVMVGDGIRRYGDLFREHLKNRLVEADDALHFPHAAYAAKLGLKRFRENGADDEAQLIPNYIRESDADIGFRGRH